MARDRADDEEVTLTLKVSGCGCVTFDTATTPDMLRVLVAILRDLWNTEPEVMADLELLVDVNHGQAVEFYVHRLLDARVCQHSGNDLTREPRPHTCADAQPAPSSSSRLTRGERNRRKREKRRRGRH